MTETFKDTDKRLDEPTVEERLDALMRRTPEELAEDRRRIMAKSRPARPLPPGKTLEEVVVGSLPDDDSDEDVLRTLKDLS